MTTGFITGLSHCAGMCGSLVSAFSIQQKQMKGSVTGPLLLYQWGRISTYVLIGLTTAAIGSSLQLAALGQGWQVGLSVFVGLMMLTIGLNLIGVFRGLSWLESARLAKWVGERIRQLMVSTHPSAPFGLGMANGMLPCGPVYAVAFLAATSQSSLQGGLIMLFFGIGTLPAMFGMGFIFAKLSVALRHRLYRLVAILIILIGVQQIFRGLALGGLIGHFHVGAWMIW
ncbi:MAG: sulfite exporter TauE/SafE family protein [Gammaproteobacteria bacterium]|nr:sulfite exporter TauE/SafE family protein [Gammaproteobacteria bacterium]